MLDLMAFKATDVPVKNMLENSNFKGGLSSWRSLLLESTDVVDGVLELKSTETSTSGRVDQAVDDFEHGDVMYVGATIKANTSELAIGKARTPIVRHSGSGDFEWVSSTKTVRNSFYYSVLLGKQNETAYVKNTICINLSTIFGQGNEPTADQMDTLLEQFPDNWFGGTRNLFDAEKFMKLYFKKMKELDSAITALGGGS